MPMTGQITAQELPSRKVLMPFRAEEAMGVAEASLMAGVTQQTIRVWCDQHCLGRLVGGRYRVSKIALAMWLDNDLDVLSHYHNSDLQHPDVQAYFTRCGLPAQLASAAS